MRQILLPSGIVKRGLVAWYDFTDPADSQVLTDKSGNGNNGQNGSTTGADTNDVTFDGVKGVFGGDDSIVLASNLLAEAFTVQIVAAYTGISYQALIGLNTGSSNVGLYPDFGSNTARLGLGATNYRSFVDTGLNMNDGNPHDFVFTLPGTAQTDINNSQLIVDLIPQAIQATDASGAQGARNMCYLGQAKTASPSYFTGSMYYAVIYNRILNMSEIRRNHSYIKKVLAGRGVFLL
jgi:hypothetical protein